jgi:hypothetical protein
MEKIAKNLHGGGYVCNNIGDGDNIPAGGSIISTKQMSIICDLQEEFFQNLFSDIEKRTKTFIESNQYAQMADWLNSAKSEDINPELFAKLFCLQKILYEKFPIEVNAKNEEERMASYSKEGQANLSELASNNQLMCLEYSILALAYLQKNGLQNSYLVSGALRSGDAESAEPHSFVAIKQNNRVLIFDIARPSTAGNSIMPSLYSLPKNFIEDITVAKKQKIFESSVVLSSYAA